MDNITTSDIELNLDQINNHIDKLYNKTNFIITLDGCVGIGKSTVARAIAQKLKA